MKPNDQNLQPSQRQRGFVFPGGAMNDLRKWIIGALVLLIAAGLYWKFRPHGKPLGEVYVGEQNVVIYNTTAQVRQRVGEAHWGDQLETVSKSGGMVQVRTLAGLTGWVDGRMLLDAGAWQREAKLFQLAKAMPVQATGKTKVFTNLRIEAGREAPRIYQLPGGVHLSIVGHAIADAAPAPKGSKPAVAKDKEKDKDESQRKEDWLLVVVVQSVVVTPNQNTQSAPAPPVQQPGDSPSASTPGGGGPPAGRDARSATPSAPANVVTGNSQAQTSTRGPASRVIPPISGWVLARFVELELPQTLRDYATSAGMRPVAWFVLNRVPDAGGDKPQYLVAGVQGPEGQSCDFTLIRVYTWGSAKHRYETAYVESDFCGYFPIRVDPQTGKPTSKVDPVFRFTALDTGSPKEDRVYAMHQTTVRRVRESASPSQPKSH